VDRGTGDGSINDLPWASVFDPAANARAFSAIQAEGFRAASEIVDRFARIATTGLNGKATETTSAAPLTNDQRADLLGATDIEPLIRSWWVMIGQLLRGSAQRAPDPVSPDGASLDFSRDEVNGQLEFRATVPGAATAEVWLHNRGASDLGRIGLRCSDLLANDGSVISAGAVSLGPASVPIPGRSSRGIEVKIQVPQGVQPGVYRGTLLVEDHPGLWLPVALTVRSSAS
jgi:hypothetical protein